MTYIYQAQKPLVDQSQHHLCKDETYTSMILGQKIRLQHTHVTVIFTQKKEGTNYIGK
jgi:hypothetical protein